jgi:hypothetical protein
VHELTKHENMVALQSGGEFLEAQATEQCYWAYFAFRENHKLVIPFSVISASLDLIKGPLRIIIELSSRMVTISAA